MASCCAIVAMSWCMDLRTAVAKTWLQDAVVALNMDSAEAAPHLCVLINLNKPLLRHGGRRIHPDMLEAARHSLLHSPRALAEVVHPDRKVPVPVA